MPDLLLHVLQHLSEHQVACGIDSAGNGMVRAWIRAESDGCMIETWFKLEECERIPEWLLGTAGEAFGLSLTT